MIPQLELEIHDSLSWITEGGVWDYTAEGPGSFDLMLEDARILTIDPGAPTGVALFHNDLAGQGIDLFHLTPEAFANGLINHLPASIEVDFVCETPLHGAVRVFDPWPWRVRGFVELFHQAVFPDDLFVPAMVGWLKPGKSLVKVPPVLGGGDHARDALRYGVVALTQHEKLYNNLRDDQWPSK